MVKNKIYLISKFFSTPLINVSKKDVLSYFFLYLLLISLGSVAYGYLLNLNNELYDENFNIIFKNISFSNGEIIHNLYYKNEYFTEFQNITFYLQKTPAIPFLIYFISLISKNFFFIIIFKNLLIFSIYFFISYVSIKSTQKSFFLFFLVSLVPIIIPYNFGVSLNFVYEDSLIAILLPSIFILLITNYKKKYFYIGIFTFILYFVKTSMFFIILIIPILILMLDKKSFSKFIPITFSCLAILIWGFYGLNKTGRFPVLNTSSSFNSYVMSFALNKDFHKYYPLKSTDLIPKYKLSKNIKNEWEFYDYYKEINREYLKKNFNRYMKDFFIKAKFIFFGINRDGVFYDKDGNPAFATDAIMDTNDNKIRLSQLISKIILNLSIIILAFNCLNNYKKIINQKKEIYYLIILILNLLPHLALWATSKHLVGIINISLIFLIFSITDRVNIRFFRNSTDVGKS